MSSKQACQCVPARKVNRTNKANKNALAQTFTFMLVLLLPKCPFCMLTYASTILLTFGMDATLLTPYMSYLYPVLLCVMLFAILAKFKGKQTYLALGFLFLGSLGIISEIFFEFTIIPDYVYLSCIGISYLIQGHLHSLFRRIYEYFVENKQAQKCVK